MSNLLYKFYPAHWGRDAMYRERFKVTTLADINDPFEFLATSPNAQLRRQARTLRKTEFAKDGVISFSKTWQEPLLWSHYAQNHSGIALGFELENPKAGFDIEYSDERVQFVEPDAPNALARFNFWDIIRVRKYSQWAYEQETRVFPSLDSAVFENGMYFLPFQRVGKLKKVILGAEYRSLEDSALQRRLNLQNIEVVTTRLGFREFKVHEQKTKSLQKMV